ncbi:response regulator transcription factor [Streptomyces sp. NPDC052236]|uniref:response regulator transcription factor n=1 Tax=Streptomyces sp. NPDC052236 TaxID=3365686 RepID=UPI0037CE7873
MTGTGTVTGAALPLRILIVDDHAVVRAGLRALVEGEPGLEVIGESGDGEEAVRIAGRLRPDVVLMDLRAMSPRSASRRPRRCPGSRCAWCDCRRR